MEVSEHLGISVSSVRRCWLSIYDRVSERAPGVLGQAATTNYGNANAVRGKGKKNRVLAYLREHPEELRPLSRKRREHPTASS